MHKRRLLIRSFFLLFTTAFLFYFGQAQTAVGLPQEGPNQAFLNPQAGAYGLSAFEGIRARRSEINFQAGLSMPQKYFSSPVFFEDLLSQSNESFPWYGGAKMGFGAELNYRYFFLRYLGLGIGIRGEYFSFAKEEFLSAIEKRYVFEGMTKPFLDKSVSYGDFRLTISLQTELPLYRELFLIAHAGASFVVLLNPFATGKMNTLSPDVYYSFMSEIDVSTHIVFDGGIGLKYYLFNQMALSLSCNYARGRSKEIYEAAQLQKHTKIREVVVEGENTVTKERWVAEPISFQRNLLNQMYRSFHVQLGISYVL